MISGFDEIQANTEVLKEDSLDAGDQADIQAVERIIRLQLSVI
jgi:hypothetical protein